jgi:hypothetical protein
LLPWADCLASARFSAAVQATCFGHRSASARRMSATGHLRDLYTQHFPPGGEDQPAITRRGVASPPAAVKG